MIVNESSCKLKMVVIIATALALGVGAVAACIVPWFYCKPPDDSDDQSNINDRSTVGIQLTGLKGSLKLEFNPESIGNADTTLPANSATSNTNLPQIQINEEPIFPVEKNKILPQSSQNVRQHTSTTSNSENSEYSENATEETSQEDQQESEDARSLEVQVQIVETGSISELTESSLMVRVEENDTNTFQTTESSNPTDEESTQSIARISSENSNRNIQAKQTSTNSLKNLQSVESTSKNTQGSNSDSIKSESFDPATQNFQSSGLESPDQNEETLTSKSFDDSNPTKDSSNSSTDKKWASKESDNSSCHSEILKLIVIESSKSSRDVEDALTTLISSDPSGRMKDSYIESTDREWASQESNNSSVSSEDLATMIIDSSIISEGLQTIPETSSRSSSQNVEPFAELSKDVLTESSKDAVTEDSQVQSSGLTAETPLEVPCGTPDSTQSVLDNHQDDTKKRSLTNRIASAFSMDRLKRKFHGAKHHKKSEEHREKICKEKLTDSLQSLSTGEKLPAAQSTMLSNNQMSSYDQMLVTIRRRRSMILNKYSSQKFDNPHIIIHSELNVDESRMRFNDEPLDLSINSSMRCKKMDSGYRNRSCNAGGDFFRDLKEHLRDWRSSRSSEKATSRSDSLKFYDGSTRSIVRDENFTSNSSLATNNTNFDENRGCVSDPEANGGCLKTKSRKRRSKTLKNLFKLGNKDRSKDSDNVSSSGYTKKGLDNFPFEFQRNSRGIKSKTSNTKVDSTSKSPENSYCYPEFDFSYLDDEKKHREPPTEL